MRPARFKELPYGGAPVLTGFSDEAGRQAFCAQVVDTVSADEPDTIISPYFYAGENEQSWLFESIACGNTTEAILAEREAAPSMWLGIAVHSTWLSNDVQRDTLLTALTSRPWSGVHLLLCTTQAAFGPLGDVAVLRRTSRSHLGASGSRDSSDRWTPSQ